MIECIDIFAAKMWVAFTMQKLLTFLQQKISMCLPYFKTEMFDNISSSFTESEFGLKEFYGPVNTVL